MKFSSNEVFVQKIKYLESAAKKKKNDAFFSEKVKL